MYAGEVLGVLGIFDKGEGEMEEKCRACGLVGGHTESCRFVMFEAMKKEKADAGET